MSNDRAAVMRLLHNWDIDEALRAECDILSVYGVKNFIEYSEPRIVRLADGRRVVPELDMATGRIKIVDSSRECD